MYCLIVYFYIFDASNDSSLYIAKNNIQNFWKGKVIIISKKLLKNFFNSKSGDFEKFQAICKISKYITHINDITHMSYI